MHVLIKSLFLSAQVEHFAQEAEEWKSTAAEWNVRHDAVVADVQKERSRSEAFERKIADLERLNDRIQQERTVSFCCV